MTGKLVWISNEDRDKAARECTSTSYGLNMLMHLFDAAPADPVKAAIDAFNANTYRDSNVQLRAVLSALGIPEASA